MEVDHDVLYALTVRQPFAFGVVAGAKTIENRTWPTNYRGRVSIHAAREWAPSAMLTHDIEQLVRASAIELFARDQASFDRVWDKRSAHLGSVTITGCHHATTCLNDDGTYCSPWAIAESWHWTLEDPAILPAPIPDQGSLGLWRPSGEILASLAATNQPTHPMKRMN